jgi:hypothetical protein
MQINSLKSEEIKNYEIDILAEVIAHFIVENILKDEKQFTSKTRPTSTICKETEASKMEIRQHHRQLYQSIRSISI